MRRIFAIWALCLCWGVLNAAPLGPFNATLLEKLKTDYQKGDKEVTQYIELQEKAAEKYIKMSPLSVTAKKKLPPSKDPRDYMTLPHTGGRTPRRQMGFPISVRMANATRKFMNTLNVRMPTVLATLPTVWAYSITSPEKKSTPKPVPIIYEHGLPTRNWV